MAMPSSSRSSPDSPPADAPVPDDLAAQLGERTNEVQCLRHELDVLLYAISHDLRAPIRSINGFSRILAEKHRGELDAEGLDCVQTIRAAAERMTHLIDGMTQLSRLVRVQLSRRDVDLTKLAHQVADELRAAYPHRSVAVAIEPHLSVVADPKLMGIVLHQLFANAWKFTAPAAAARVEFGRAAVGSGVAFVVRDNGVGFDSRYVDKLFKPFQRLHAQEEFPGSGIGLAAVDRVVRCHGGRVWAESVPGQGASFYFSLPSS